MVERTGLMTVEEFVRLYETEGPFELVNGERIILSPPKAGHVSITRNIWRPLDRFVLGHDLGEVFVEGPFVLTDNPSWVLGARVPDVMFFTAERLARYKAETPDWRDKPFILIPDLVVEVISSNDSYTEVTEKVDHYLVDGVRMVWIVDEKRRTLAVRTPTEYYTLTINDTVTGGDVLPEFTMKVSEVFA